MNQIKKVLCVALCAAMILSFAGCGGQDNTTAQAPAQTTEQPAEEKKEEAPAEEKKEEEKEEEKKEEASAKEDGKKAPLFPVTDVITSSPYYEEFDLTPTAEEKAAMESEPMHGQTIKYWYDGGNCTSAPYVAQKLGLFEECGIQTECLNGTAVKEALGTNAAQFGVSHIASLLVPITNDVNYTFIMGAHVGCKSLYVLGDSDYKSTEDLKNTRIAVPNGIGNSDYNITARLLDKDGINPLTDVELTPVESSACVAAMQNGEISAALLSDTYAYKMVQDGTLRLVRSLLDEDFAHEPCCVVAMNNDFLNENPVTAKKLTQCLKKASNWMRNNPEEAVNMLLDDGKISRDYDMNLELWNTLKFGLTDEYTKAGLEQIIDDYIRLGLITSTKDADALLEKAWHPQAPEA